MISGEWQKVMQRVVRLPCGVCDGNNSIHCTSCQKWEHRKCSGIKGSMYKVKKSFVCRACVNPVTSKGCTSVDIGGNANLELVNKFCYLGDMLSVDRDADGKNSGSWYHCLQISIYSTLMVRGRLYSSGVQSIMLHGSET